MNHSDDFFFAIQHWQNCGRLVPLPHHFKRFERFTVFVDPFRRRVHDFADFH